MRSTAAHDGGKHKRVMVLEVMGVRRAGSRFTADWQVARMSF